MYSRILVPIDGSNPSVLALTEAIKLAKALHACIRLMHVIDSSPSSAVALEGWDFPAALESARTAGQQLLTEAQARVSREGIEVDTALIEAVAETAGACIIGKAREWHADLIICGTHGRRGLERLLMGSDSEYVLRHAPVPVLLIRAPQASAHDQRAA